jgi:hypothetical protein
VGGGVVAVHGFEVSLHISHLHEKRFHTDALRRTLYDTLIVTFFCEKGNRKVLQKK